MTTTPPLSDLPADHLACRYCGRAVPRSEDQSPPLPVARGLSLGTCPDCLGRTVAAAAAVAGLPTLVARVGSETAAAARLGAALHALALIGQKAVDLDSEAAWAAVRHLAGPGSVALWLARYVPTPTGGATSGQCAAGPWSHVSSDLRAEVAEGAARLLAERVARHAPPVAVVPPTSDRAPWPACLLCGVASVRVPAAKVAAMGGPALVAAEFWRPITTSLQALGGRSSPDPVRGHLCGQCAQAVDDAGAVGHRAALAALTTHLRDMGRTDDAALLRQSDVGTFPTWGALAVRAHSRGRTLRPNPSGWGHLTMPEVDA